ncbi:cytochrome c biogenesis CcdA family protein [Roseisolibacter agri]|uniref:Cytochrome C biogenesis protein CcdA n=1 Tax=Roseisolibacter agri TaxID=2014610 RepID=A0AA37Q9J6_9BACT|nr:cytochrome c biogenesis protein CcdA [Roseisolibacter agri]GLC26207.1 cytochrome C biogenesis protein CcdA [Roseisolibacter agri]
METSVGFIVAFTAGLLSFLSPCVLPLIPSYVTFITGLSLDDATRARRAALVHSLLFVLGFSLIFIALGAGATALGRLLIAYRGAITKIGGVLIVVFGLYLLGVFNVALFARERRVHLADKPAGYLGTVLVGIAFGAGWTPCIGPILGAIFTYNMSNPDLVRGTGLLASYSLGLAVPFVASALALQHFLDFFARIRSKLLVLSRVSGALLIVVGVLMVTNQFTRLATRLQALTPDAIYNRI